MAPPHNMPLEPISSPLLAMYVSPGRLVRNATSPSPDLRSVTLLKWLDQT